MKTIKITNMDRSVCTTILKDMGITKKGVQEFVKAERKIINNCYVDDITINIPLDQLDSFRWLCIEQKDRISKMPTNSVGNNVGNVIFAFSLVVADNTVEVKFFQLL